MAKKEIILVWEPGGAPWALCAVYTPIPEKGPDFSIVEEKIQSNKVVIF